MLHDRSKLYKPACRLVFPLPVSCPSAGFDATAPSCPLLMALSIPIHAENAV